MNFNQGDIKKIAHLARIQIDESSEQALQKDLTSILTMIEELGKLDTTQTPPLAHPLEETQPLREDLATETDQRETFQRLAPLTDSGLYLVPQVIESE